MIVDDEESWPSELLAYLASKHESLLADAMYKSDRIDAQLDLDFDPTPEWMTTRNPHAQDYQQARQSVHQLLQSTTLRGWHCTRLTKDEVEYITVQGMQPPNLQFLESRIRRVQANGIITGEIADRLILKNQADDSSRKGRIWFCFFEPRIAGQSGIERLFRCWGGEALYNSHESDPETGKALQKIGRPCLVEVDVPISSFDCHPFLSEKVIRRFLLNRGYDCGEALEYEDRSTEPIPGVNIIRFVFHGGADFAALTGCDSWKPPLV